MGKFYHRPPGGESWADVGLRVRAVIDTLCREHAGERVLITPIKVVVLMFRYTLEAMTEAEVLELSHSDPVAHCSVTTYVHSPSEDAAPWSSRPTTWSNRWSRTTSQ